MASVQPLDYSSTSPQPDILDLCVRPQPRSSSTITLLQQQLLRPGPGTEDVSLFGYSAVGTAPALPLSAQVFNTTSSRNSKPTRPFKAYPKDPLSLSVGVSTAEALLGQTSNEAYAEFRRRMLEHVQVSSNPSSSTSKSRPSLPAKRALSPQHPTSSDSGAGDAAGRDAAYWERRRKNNEAAKRSRDARRAKEDEIAIRAAFLEQENLKLKYELAALRSETAKLRCLLYNS